MMTLKHIYKNYKNADTPPRDLSHNFLRHTLHVKLPSVTPLAIVESRNIFVAGSTSIGQSRIRFYFVQCLILSAEWPFAL